MMETTLSHDQLIDSLFEEMAKTKKAHITSLFLSSFSSNDLRMRSGLAAYAIMQSFPKHDFLLREGQELNDFSPCTVCSCYQQITIDEGYMELLSECFMDVGGLATHGNLFDYLYYLQEANNLPFIAPNSEDFRIFSEIITILLDTDADSTVKKEVSSKINKIKGVKSVAYQRQALLETLGYCSILETSEHKGLLNQYTNIAVAPSKTHSSDWNYPVDFWLGKDGINKEAFKFWFGEYPQLEKFWK